MLGIRTAITQSDLLLAGEQVATLTIPTPDGELLAAELAGLDRKPDAADAERRRLIDLDPGGFIQMPKMQRCHRDRRTPKRAAAQSNQTR